MLKLVKYEFHGRLKFNIILISSLIIGYLLALRQISTLDTAVNENYIKNMKSLIIYAPYAAALLAIVVSGVRLFKRDLNRDTGYLIYSLPRKAYSINGAKLLQLYLEMVLVSIISFCFITPVTSYGGYDFVTGFNSIVVLITAHILAAMLIVLMINLSEIVGKMAYTKKRGIKLTSFYVFLLLVIIIGTLNGVIQKVFALSLWGDHFSLHFVSIAIGKFNFEFLPIVPNPQILISQFFYCTLIFMGSSYLLDRNMDI